MAVVPEPARLFGERQFRKPLGEGRIVDIALEQIGAGVELADRTVAIEAIGDARGVTQEVFDRDRARERLSRELAVLTLLCNRDLHVSESRDVLAQGIG